jgi:hypothetical protein
MTVISTLVWLLPIMYTISSILNLHRMLIRLYITYVDGHIAISALSTEEKCAFLSLEVFEKHWGTE